MPIQFTPLPFGSALRWAAQQRVNLEAEGFGCAVLDAVQPLLTNYARTGEQSSLELALRLLRGDH